MKRNLIKICLLTGLIAPCAPLYAAHGESPVVTQQQTVKGHVVDETGEPLIGVTVQIVGKTGGAVTDLAGIPLHPGAAKYYKEVGVLK